MKNVTQPKGYSLLVNYKNIKKKREKFLKNHFSGLRNAKRKTPWYMLTSGKQFNYEERKETWGTILDYFRVDSEMKELEKKNSIPRGVRGECKLELYTKHKLNKWIKRNPKPCDDRDLFADQYLPEWENRKKEAIQRIEKQVKAIYTFNPIRFRIYSDIKKGSEYSHFIADIKIKELANKSINHMDTNDKVILKIKAIIDKHRTNDFVSALIYDKINNCGRIIL